METTITPPESEGLEQQAGGATAGLIRGSSLLLFGRGVQLVLKMVVQVIIVRYLAKADFGALAYALSLVALGESISTFGLDRAVTRFLPIYEEREEYGKMLGTVVLVISSIVGLGLALVVVGFGVRAAFGAGALGGSQAFSLLVILVALAPIRSLDNVMMGMFAVFSKPTAIFFRKYLLEPGIEILIVVLLVSQKAPVSFLAKGYVVGAIIGVVVYTWMLFKMLSERGLLARFRQARREIPVREVFGFTLPLLSSDLLYGVMGATDAIILNAFAAKGQGAIAVGAFRVVQPTARLNLFVMLSFTMLFTPVAARLFARQDHDGLRHAYGQSAVWMSILGFPVFAVTFALARPMTTALYGRQYASSALVLSLLSVGYYVSTVSGFNGLTLKVVGKLRAIVAINLVALVINLALNLVLIRFYGINGAAIGTTATLLLHNLMKQYAVGLVTGVRLFDERRRGLYLTMAGGVGILLAAQQIADPPFIVGLGLAGIISLVVLAQGRHLLQMDETFPELMRFRAVRAMFGGANGRAGER
jgi:O-antigen/teichoic acid export membrane protein